MKHPLVMIASQAHIPRMHAHKLLMDADYPNWMFVVDTEEQHDRARSVGIPEMRIMVTFRPQDIPPQDGIAWTRQWIEQNAVPKNSWYVTLDDNIRGWTKVPSPWYELDAVNLDYPYDGRVLTSAEWREIFARPVPVWVMAEVWNQMIDECEKRGTLAGGFAIETNHFYRTRKWQTLGYVRAQNAVWKNTGLPFYYWEGNMFEDFTRSVDVVARTGSVLINRFVKPIKTFFEPGGIGTFEERRPNLVEVCRTLMDMYPGLLRHNKGQDYSLSFESAKRVEEWRKKHGYHT